MILKFQKKIEEVLKEKHGIKLEFNIEEFKKKQCNLNSFLNFEKHYYETFLEEFKENDKKFEEIKSDVFKELSNKYFDKFSNKEAKKFIIEQIELSINELNSHY